MEYDWPIIQKLSIHINKWNISILIFNKVLSSLLKAPNVKLHVMPPIQSKEVLGDDKNDY